MSEKEMVAPRCWSYVHRTSTDFLDHSDDQNTSKKYFSRVIKQHVYSKRICYLMHKEVTIERCEYRVNAAICYNGRTNDKLRTVKTDFAINDALYTRMESNEHIKDYLILVGDDQIMFWKVENGECHVISVPFRIERVFSSEFGIIIERSRIAGEKKSNDIPCTIYSLVHPFSEILSVIYRDDDSGDTWYAFSQRKIVLIPSQYQNTGKYFLGYDTQQQKHMLFALRKCTLREKTEASKILSTSFATPDASPILSTTSFSHMRSTVNSSNKSTPSLSVRRSTRGNDTPLRRSIRNRLKPVLSAKSPVPDLDASYASSVFSTKSQEQSLLKKIRHTFRVFDLNGEESDELDVDYMFDCIWTEASVSPLTSTPVLAGTPKNFTPKSILTRRDDGTPVSTYSKDGTPNRSVKFVEKESEENLIPSPLMHKKPIQQTPVKPVSFKNDLSSKNSSTQNSAEEIIDSKNFNDCSNARLLVVLDELIVRHRHRLLQAVLPKEAQREPREEQPIAFKDYIKARKNIMKYYVRLMQKGLQNGNKSVKAFYALLLYRKELWQVVRNQVRSKSSKVIYVRAASRFFMTTDMSGQKYLCFLPNNESSVKMLKFNLEKNVLISVSTLNAFDAINIPGNNMMAVLNNSAVSLYTGNNFIGTLITKPFRHSSHELLQFLESYDKTIIIKAQHKKRLFVQNILFDLDLIASSQIKKLFQAIFSTLPIEKAVKFYSTWYSVNRLNSLDNALLLKKSFLLELPLMIEHFFSAMGLQVKGLTCMEFICNMRLSDSTPETKKNRKQSESDDDEIDEDEEPMEIYDEDMSATYFNPEELLKQAIKDNCKIIVSEAEGKENYIENHAFLLFQSFHLFFESLNIFLYSKKFKPILLEPLYVFSKIVGLHQYVQNYSSYLPELSELIIEVEEGTVLPNADEATAFNAEPMVSFNMFLAQLKSRHIHDPQFIPDNPHWPVRILFCAFVVSGKINNLPQLKQCLGPHWQKRLNLSLADEKALISIIVSQRSDNDTKCSRCVKLFGLSLGDIHVLDSVLANSFTPLIPQLAKRLEKNLSKMKLKSFPSEEEQKRWTRLQWPTDIRSNNVNQMLDSSRQILIPVRRSDDDTINREQYNLFLVSTYSKQVSKSFGRAAVEFRSTRATKISSMQIPKIELNGRVPPNHVFHEFPNGEITKPMNDWADFMAGTAFTLSLTAHDNGQMSFAWLRQWQSTHRSTAVSSGCLYAYGLAGHFKTVNTHEIHQMLVKFKKPIEIISVLLGFAVTYRGTSDIVCYRVLSTHAPSFIEPTLVELKFDCVVQIASILGIGLLFQGSTCPTNTNRITNEMAKETFFDGENESYRYSYVLCCGIAVGLINLGRGVDIRRALLPAADSNYEIEERLIVLLEGGKRVDCTDFGRRNSQYCRVQRIGAAALGSVALPPSANSCSTLDFATLHGIGVNPEPNGMHAHNNEVNRYTANSVIGTLTKESSTTRELSNVNIHLTSPAAAIALALMYLKTGDKYIIQKLTVPETLPEIEMIRPDVLMLRTLCALMVDYDNILTSSDYLDNLIPKVIMRFVRDVEYASTDNEWWAQSIDMNTVAEAYYYIKSGICLAIGIRYASSYNSEATVTIRNFLDEVAPLGKDYMIPKLRRFTKTTLTNSCAAIAVYSLSLIMAGSGDLETLKCIRQVRNHLPDNLAVESDSFIYAVQTFCNTALGFLFLGNSRYGFSQSTEATAMLLISSYPIFSQSICDQKNYFQPLRFLWSITTEYRYLAPVDDATYEAVRMQAKINVKGENEKPMIFQLPSVLPPLSSIKKIVIYARDYKETELDMSNAEDKAYLEKVLNEYFGRIPVKRVVKPYSQVFDNTPAFKISDTFDCAAIKNDSFLMKLPLS